MCCITNAFFQLQMINSLSKIEKEWISYWLDIYLAISNFLTLSIHNFNMHSDFLPLTLNFLSTNFTFCTRLANNSKCTTFQTQKDKRITCSKQHNIHVWPSVTMATESLHFQVMILEQNLQCCVMVSNGIRHF